MNYWPSLIPVQDVEPAASAEVWVDTSTAPPTLKGWNGSAWVAIGAGGGSTDPEVVRDTMAAALVAGANITITPNDAGDTITIAAAGGGGGGAALGPHLSGRYHWNAAFGGAWNSAFAPAVGTLYVVPFWVGNSTTYNEIKTAVGTAGAAGAVTRLGIYNVASSGLPGTLVVDAGTIDCTTTGDKALTISTALNPGVYFIVQVCNDAAVRWRALGSSPQPNPLTWFGNTGPIEMNVRYLTFTGYTATSALPATATTAGVGYANSDYPLTTLKAA